MATPLATYSNDDRTRARENWERFVYGRDNGHTEFVNKARVCNEYWKGNQWRPEDEARLRAQGRPVLTMNMVFSQMATISGEQLQNQADISFRPLLGGSTDVADALTKLWIVTANANKLDHLESQVFDSGMITSRGFYDVRMSFESNIRGEVQISYLKPQNVVIDPDASSYDPDDWNEWILTGWYDLDAIERLYGKDRAEALKYKTQSSFEYGFDSIDKVIDTFSGRQPGQHQTWPGLSDPRLRRVIRVIERQHKRLMRKEHFVDLTTGDTRIIPEGWPREKIKYAMDTYGLGTTKKMAAVHHWTVSADDVLLHDDTSPYDHFTVVPYFPFFKEGQTSGIVEHLLSPQDALNKTISQELHVINTTANSGWQMEQGQLTNMDATELEQRGAETGLVLERTPGSAPLEKIQPNQVPTGLDRFSFKMTEFTKQLSGVSDSLRGFDRADVAAKAIQAKAQAGTVNLAKPFQNLTFSRHLLAERVCKLWQRFYTEERTYSVTARGIGAKTQDIQINKYDEVSDKIINDITLGKYQVVVASAPARDTFEDTQFQQALGMREKGIAIPDSVIIEHSNLAGKSEILSQMQSGQEDSSGAQQQAQQLELQRAQMEIENLKADALRKKAETAKALADAQVTAQQGPQSSPDPMLEHQLNVEKARHEAQLKERELMLKAAAQQQELKIKEATARHGIAIEHHSARQRLELERDGHEHKKKMAEENNKAKAKQQPKNKE